MTTRTWSIRPYCAFRSWWFITGKSRVHSLSYRRIVVFWFRFVINSNQTTGSTWARSTSVTVRRRHRRRHPSRRVATRFWNPKHKHNTAYLSSSLSNFQHPRLLYIHRSTALSPSLSLSLCNSKFHRGQFTPRTQETTFKDISLIARFLEIFFFFFFFSFARSYLFYYILYVFTELTMLCLGEALVTSLLSFLSLI